MATDGVRILDSDQANDTYSTIIGLFEDGLDQETVLQRFPFKRHAFGLDDDYYDELFVTAYALAFWEIGWLNKDIVQAVEEVIAKATSVRVWIDEYGRSAGKSRQKVLDKFMQKIHSQNPRPRKRRKYKQTEIAFFAADDLLAYKNAFDNYRALVCVKVDIDRGKHCYTFVPTSYYEKIIPTLKEIINYGIYGVKIAVSGSRESVSQSQEGVHELWNLFSEKTFLIPEKAPFIIGLVQDLVLHKDMKQFKDKLFRIGTLKIKQQFNKQGSGSFSKNFEQFDKDSQYYKNLKYCEFPIKILCEL